MNTQTDNQQLVLEMAYNTWHDSCQNPAAFGADMRECRRVRGHRLSESLPLPGLCASGTTVATLRTWGNP